MPCLERIRISYSESVESIENLESSPKELFSIIAGWENEIINDGLFKKLIDFHKIKNNKKMNIVENMNIPLRNEEISFQSIIEAVL